MAPTFYFKIEETLSAELGNQEFDLIIIFLNSLP
jgi:hypothetical protein